MAHSDRSNGKFKIGLKLAGCLHKTVLTSIHIPFPFLAILDRKYSVQIVNMPNSREIYCLSRFLCRYKYVFVRVLLAGRKLRS